ncbi:2'-5' RNA ligase [Oxalobacteraceae bacterium GrIS 2.11]
MGSPPKYTENSSRLYLALWPDRDTQNRLQSMRHAWTWPKTAKVVKPESLHLTLHFLGDIPDQRLPDLIQGLKVPVQPFDLILSRPQLWPQGVAVVKPNSVPMELMQLHERLNKALQNLGISIERRTYRPHVTFARNATDAIPPTAQQVQPVLWQNKGYALVKSQNGYTILHSYE